jgi:hypothetical protein
LVVEQIQIEARGLTFDALAAGPQDRTRVMLLHGVPRTNFEWHNQMPVLAEAGFRVVAPNMRGYSPGARPEGVEAYSNEEFAQDVIAMADARVFGERAEEGNKTSICRVGPDKDALSPAQERRMLSLYETNSLGCSRRWRRHHRCSGTGTHPLENHSENN